MAKASRVLPEQKTLDKYNEGNFEEFIKNRLSWQRDDWDEEGEPKVRLRKLISSMRYWGKKLEKAQSIRNVIITLYNDQQDAKVDLTDILDAIWLMDEKIEIKGYTFFRNPRYVSITFENEQIKNFVQDNFKFVGPHNVVFLNWSGGGSIQSIRTHWYPDDMEIIHTKEVLEKYFMITEQFRESTTMLSGMKLPCGIVYSKGVLKKGVNINDVPHLVDIEGLECLITVYGRKYLCLTCNKVGHKARNCTTPYCNKCRKLMPIKHICEPRNLIGKSYVNVVKSDAANLINIAHEDDASVEISCGSKHITQELKENISAVERRDEYLKLREKEKKILAKTENKEVQPAPNGSREDMIQVTNVINKVSNESLENNSLTFNWADTGEGSGEERVYHDSGEESDVEETCKEGLINMEKQLLELKRISDNVKINKNYSAEIGSDSSSQTASDSKMVVDQSSLKRKSDFLFGNVVEESTFSGPRITYRCHGRSRGSRQSKTNKNSNKIKM